MTIIIIFIIIMQNTLTQWRLIKSLILIYLKGVQLTKTFLLPTSILLLPFSLFFLCMPVCVSFLKKIWKKIQPRTKVYFLFFFLKPLYVLHIKKYHRRRSVRGIYTKTEWEIRIYCSLGDYLVWFWIWLSFLLYSNINFL